MNCSRVSPKRNRRDPVWAAAYAVALAQACELGPGGFVFPTRADREEAAAFADEVAKPVPRRRAPRRTRS